MKTFYIVEIETRLKAKVQYHKVSQEGYKSFQEARAFILSRHDKPEEKYTYIFQSEYYTYTIREITIK